MWAGWETWDTEPGIIETWRCRVCDEDTHVTRNLNGPTSLAESLAGMKHLHDRFTCPHVDKDWHEQVLHLKKEQEKTKSPSLKKILEEDIRKILYTRKTI